MVEQRRTFLPAAGHDWLLPLYDPLQWLFGGDRLRREVIEAAALEPGHRALDIGCGTGALLVELARRHPRVEAVGLDPDPRALARARRKLERAGAPVQLDEGFSDELPYPDRSFDRVFSTLMLHHLKPGEKERTLAEALRVLRPGGSLHLVDFGGSGERADGWLARALHPGRLHDGYGDRIAGMMRYAGFAEVRRVDQRTTLFGRVAHYEGRADAPQK